MALQNNRKSTPLILAVMSASIFILAVLFSAIPAVGFYISLALVVLGGFTMLIAGMIREASTKKGLPIPQKVTDPDMEDVLA
jgi:peptidoglycan/LPS O-acetylase OafA/YrhL